ncbi:MAG: methyltransferase domain-containing protein [Gammaproteobacteria bacterium]|nr:methyltransferase domain-containing protein [Gammaproteobacteria bacterium]MDH3767198.1 methyltransferase domain-containing protein [Gammaproteobacteria bacterium]
MAEIYDAIGTTYAIGRRSDPCIASHIHRVLSGAESILNLGAGTGSYEPAHKRIVAVEPSEAMIKQRGSDAAVVVKANAESLPFAAQSFSHCLSILSMHHWVDRPRAFDEIKRVTRNRLVVVTWDPQAAPFWLTRDYFPQVYEIDGQIFPTLAEFRDSFSVIDVSVLPIPANCLDGFTGAYWRRPAAYLDPEILANMSTFARIEDLDDPISRLRNDLESGAWEERNKEILAQNSLDIGYRIVTAELGQANRITR